MIFCFGLFVCFRRVSRLENQALLGWKRACSAACSWEVGLKGERKLVCWGSNMESLMIDHKNQSWRVVTLGWRVLLRACLGFWIDFLLRKETPIYYCASRKARLRMYGVSYVRTVYMCCVCTCLSLSGCGWWWKGWSVPSLPSFLESWWTAAKDGRMKVKKHALIEHVVIRSWFLSRVHRLMKGQKGNYLFWGCSSLIKAM